MSYPEVDFLYLNEEDMVAAGVKDDFHFIAEGGFSKVIQNLHRQIIRIPCSIHPIDV